VHVACVLEGEGKECGKFKTSLREGGGERFFPAHQVKHGRVDRKRYWGSGRRRHGVEKESAGGFSAKTGEEKF